MEEHSEDMISNPSVNDVDQRHHLPTNMSKVDDATDVQYRKSGSSLQRLLRLSLQRTLSVECHGFSFYVPFLVLFALQVIKVSLLTTEMINFGQDRGSFKEIVSKGELALKHLLIKDWDASWETVAYPPAHGDFAVYTVDDLVDGVNHAVRMYYNAHTKAIGYYMRLADDKMKVQLKYFDFSGFDQMFTSGLRILETCFEIGQGLNESIDNTTDDVIYDFDISKEFNYLNISKAVKRLLSLTLNFTLHSVRVHATDQKARCLEVSGNIVFEDLDNNGQVEVEFKTTTIRITCAEMNIRNVSDLVLANTSEKIGVALLLFTGLSLVLSVLSVIFDVYVCLKTKVFMGKYYTRFYQPVSSEETDLPLSEYWHLIKLWDIWVILGDIFSLYGTVWIVFMVMESKWVIGLLDYYTMWLGLGSLISWICLLRFFKIHEKFYLLFSTIYHSFGDVLAFIFCVSVLFMGFWICGYVVLGPYHVKFQTPSAAMETLAAMVTGDEIFMTLESLETQKVGNMAVLWFSRVYVVVFVGMFTVIVLNLLIAIFNNSFDVITEMNEKPPDERNKRPLESAIRGVLRTSSVRGSFRTSIHEMLSKSNRQLTSSIEDSFRQELQKLVRVSSNADSVELVRPRTIECFMKDTTFINE
ncbi:mucolipin-2-like [Dreissena polymorpha]|uniref:Uncharacterized protein n=1 Tax=Dreissena polymorpha TaxID=45954 RepID=A0A9D4EBK0_DREPO|nr:mucolipin-2-like [Dreissena polymorpha]XP_052231581.1 mucolipin-2-like [Dreissena polymorpha]KAH3777519.1 hypothetical protein DPMN_178966 [Dreissena polymorpha]